MAGRSTTQATNNLRAWRNHAGLTLMQLAEKVGTTASILSELESGHTQLSDKWLRRIAPALGTRPGIIFDHNPADLDADVLG